MSDAVIELLALAQLHGMHYQRVGNTILVWKDRHVFVNNGWCLSTEPQTWLKLARTEREEATFLQQWKDCGCPLP